MIEKYQKNQLNQTKTINFNINIQTEVIIKTLNNNEADSLRLKAEKLLKKMPVKSIPEVSEADLLKLIHELEVHQIELEMQNEELKKAKEQAVIALEKYIELYDFAPTSYITLSATGKIEKTTLTGAEMLGNVRSHLFYSNFDSFVTDDTKPAFRDFLAKVFESKVKQKCQISLKVNGEEPFPVHIDGIVSEQGKECYICVMDISDIIK